MSDLDAKITEACHRIEELYYETEGKCYISFSGGKDSTVLLALTKLCEEIYTIPANSIPAVFANTGIEMGITVEFVRWVKANYYPNVIEIRPEHSFDWVIKNHGKPIRSKLRSEFLSRWQKGKRSRSVYMNFIDGFTNSGNHAGRTKLADRDAHMLSDAFSIRASSKCCTILKKSPFKKFAESAEIRGYAYGIREGEGGARALNTIALAHKKGDRICTSISGGIIKKAVIIDWTDDDIEEFISRYNVPLSRAYTEYGFHRTGCMACPFAMDADMNLKYLHDHEPNRYKASMHWLKDVYIAQNVILPFDEEYERERERMWFTTYEPMRQEMLRKYRPNSKLIKTDEQISIFDLLNEEEENERI